MSAAKTPVVLCVLDGWGWREERANNAVALATTPQFDALWQHCPTGFLATSGADVGLPQGQFGNSEVGHMNLGAGRVVMQDLPRIDRAIESGGLAENPGLAKVASALTASGGTCHLMGLVSDGGVHAHSRHIAALAKALATAGVPVAIHAFTDGRDTAPHCADSQLAAFLADLDGCATVATVTGRFYAMDRDQRWDRVQAAFNAVVEGAGAHTADSVQAAIAAAAARGETDEFIAPTVIGVPRPIRDGDGILMANFRADRAREILAALLLPGFDGFARARVPALAAAGGMVQYSSGLALMMTTLFPPQDMADTLGQVVAERGLTQLRLAETEKYPHVTFFLNGGREEPFGGEDRILVPSPKVKTYDLQPSMSAPEVGAHLEKAIRDGKHDLIVCNFANPDMVGHTGDLAAAITAVEAVDQQLGLAVAAVGAVGGAMLVTADHGNCELMIDPDTGAPHTAHTLYKVPAVLVGGPAGVTALRDGRLADVAPTLLALMGLDPPAAMTGRSLLSE